MANLSKAPRKSRLNYAQIDRLRVKGCTYAEISKATGLSVAGVGDYLRARKLLNVAEYREGEENYLIGWASVNYATAQLLMDRSLSRLVTGDDPNYRDIDAACRLATANAILFDKLRLLRGESTANSSLIVHHYGAVADLPPAGMADATDPVRAVPREVCSVPIIKDCNSDATPSECGNSPQRAESHGPKTPQCSVLPQPRVPFFSR